MSEFQSEFSVVGLPVQQGSMRHVGRGRIIHSNDSALKRWRERVAEAAQAAGIHAAPRPDAVKLTVTFTLPRPKSVPSRKRNAPTVAPDLDKLVRAIGDALTGVAYEDDSQIITLFAVKQYADDCESGVQVAITTLPNVGV